MAQITREASWPITDGETASAADVELEFQKLFNLVNGNIDNTNVSGSADIDGSKLKDDTVANAKLTDDTITTAKLATNTLQQVHISTATSTATLTTSTSFVDVPAVTSWTVTPGNANDIFELNLMFSIEHVLNAQLAAYHFGFSIDGVDSNPLAIISDVANYNTQVFTYNVTYLVAAGATSSMVVKPRYKDVNAVNTLKFAGGSITDTIIFTGKLIPQK